MSPKIKGFGIGIVAFILFTMMRNVIPLHNMLFFVMACVVFAAAALLSYSFIRKISENTNPIVSKIWNILIAAMLGIWMILFGINETNTEHALDASELIRRYFPFPLWIALMFAGTITCLFFLRKSLSEKAQKIRGKIRLTIALLFTFGTSIQFYAPNIFQDIQGGTYHSHAYTNSIINVCWLIPYSKNMESLYGHYAILYMPILKLLHKCFHIDYLTGIFLVTAFLAGVSILLFLYVLNAFAKNDLIFYLGMFAIGEEYFMLMQGGVFGGNLGGHAQRGEPAGEKQVALIHRGGNAPPLRGQADLPVRVHGDVPLLPQVLHGHADAGLAELHLGGDVYGPHRARALVENEYSLQIIFRRFLYFFQHDPPLL